MSCTDPALRVYLLARALRVVPCEGKPARLMHSAEADVLLYALHRRWVPSIETFMDVANGLDGGGAGYDLIVPLFSKRKIWTFSSELNSGSMLRAFWRAVVEMVFGVQIQAAPSPAALPGHHSLVFYSRCNQYEIEVSDDRGDEWYFVVRLAHTGSHAEDARSRAGTPVVEDVFFGENFPREVLVVS